MRDCHKHFENPILLVLNITVLDNTGHLLYTITVKYAVARLCIAFLEERDKMNEAFC